MSRGATVYKCWGLVLQDENCVPQEVEEFAKGLQALLGGGDLPDTLQSTGVGFQAYHGFSAGQPCVFGINLESYQVNMKNLPRLVSGSLQELTTQEQKEVWEWEAKAAPYILGLLEKHGLPLGVCWLVGTD